MALVGCITFQFTIVAPKAVSISGAVSPITREMESRIPVKIPPNPDGIKILNTTFIYDEPNANPASLYERGNIFSVSSVERTTIGSIIIVNATLPASAEYPPNGFTTQA